MSYIDSVTQPKIVERATTTTPQTTQTAYFTVTGEILITQIVGEVTTELGSGAANFDLWANPTVGADVALCAVVDTNTDVVGTLYNITGTLADAMVATTSGAFEAQATPVMVAAGTIDLKSNASKTGNIQWTLHYIPLSSNGSVVAA